MRTLAFIERQATPGRFVIASIVRHRQTYSALIAFANFGDLKTLWIERRTRMASKG